MTNIDSTPIAIESNAFILFTKKKSPKANRKNKHQIGKIAFLIKAEGRA